MVGVFDFFRKGRGVSYADFSIPLEGNLCPVIYE